MRHKGIDKDEARKRMVVAIGKGFRKNGFSGIGVDGLAKSAGMTSGAFYSHFGSKDKAFNIALSEGLDEVISGIPEFQREYQADWVKAFADYYLSKSHRSDLECGCAMASLTPEVIRFGDNIHTTYEAKMTQIVELIANGLVGGNEKERLDRAWSMLGILIGGVNIARAMKTLSLSDEISSSIKSSAIKVAGPVRKQYK